MVSSHFFFQGADTASGRMTDLFFLDPQTFFSCVLWIRKKEENVVTATQSWFLMVAVTFSSSVNKEGTVNGGLTTNKKKKRLSPP